jgi:hypothetical protein
MTETQDAAKYFPGLGGRGSPAWRGLRGSGPPLDNVSAPIARSVAHVWEQKGDDTGGADSADRLRAASASTVRTGGPHFPIVRDRSVRKEFRAPGLGDDALVISDNADVYGTIADLTERNV